LVLVALSVVEQRLDAVRLVLAGATVTEVAARVGVSRQTLHSWLSRYLASGLAGLVDRSRRPNSCPHRCNADVEVVVVEMRRKHPRWGAKRIRMQLLKAGGAAVVPAERTINRILSRHGLLEHKTRKRRRESFKRWQRDAPMRLWQMDIVGGVMIVDPATTQLREAKVVTGVDDHSRYCVIAKVVARPTGRAVCLALAEALAKFGVPEEILTDNGKQFTDRFGKGGEVLFDKICRLNGIAHRLTAPASPTTTGKVERFHLTLRRELLDGRELFESLDQAQGAVDVFVADYNGERPHQALDVTQPVSPQQRFTPTPQAERALLELWVPPTLARRSHPARSPTPRQKHSRPVNTTVGRSNSTMCPPRETCRWRTNSSGSARRARGWWRGLGRLRPDPRLDRRGADQDPPLPPVHLGSGQPRRLWCRAGRARAAARHRRRRRTRGRPGGVQRRADLVGQ
jgi:transposase InsO family protein